jgi:hypothetical protein
MKADRIALFVALSALAAAPVALQACATADLIAAPGVDAGPFGVVSESGTDAPSTSDAGDAGDASDAEGDASSSDADASRDAAPE